MRDQIGQTPADAFAKNRSAAVVSWQSARLQTCVSVTWSHGVRSYINLKNGPPMTSCIPKADFFLKIEGKHKQSKPVIALDHA